MTTKKSSTTQKPKVLAQVVASFSESFEDRFQILARNPHLLAFVARSVNGTSNFRIELEKLKTEISSFKARLR